MAGRLRGERAADAGDAGDAKQGRVAQLRTAYSLTRQSDPRVGLIVAGGFLLPLLLLLLLGFLLGHPVLFGVLGLLIGFIVATSLFTRRVQKASYAAVAGQPGVAAAVVERTRGGWKLSPAVQVNRSQGMVHRALGRPGVVLLGEGTGAADLVAAERRRLRKAVGDTPVTVVMVGDGEGQTPVQKLQVQLMKLPRVLSPAQVTTVEQRIRALAGTGPGQGLPIPKGPMPTRVPRGGRSR